MLHPTAGLGIEGAVKILRERTGSGACGRSAGGANRAVIRQPGSMAESSLCKGGTAVKTVPFASVEVGTELSPVKRTVTQETFWRYAVASLDYNPVHCDPVWVRTAQPFGLPATVAHGMMTMSYMLSVVSHWAYPANLRISAFDAKLIWPVIAGSTVTCTGVISEKHIICPGKNHVVVDLEAVDQNGKLVAAGSAKVMFPD